MRIKPRCNKPVLITENRIANKSDRYRAPFIMAHLDSVKKAIDEGANVIGYLHWSFMDNYEWLDNYRPEAKFGLFSINLKSVDHREGQDPFHRLDLSRQITKGAEALELIIKESQYQNKDGVVTNSAIVATEDKFGTFAPDGSCIIRP